MAKLNGSQIRELAVDVVRRHPDGIRYSDLVNAIRAAHPETPVNTIHGSVWDLEVRFPNQVFKPARGLYRPRGTAVEPVETPAAETAVGRIREADFYGSFAEYLRNELDECTKARAAGGAFMKSKWGTPDVIGVYKPLARDLIKFPTEIVAAEIKADANQPVTAFGQAVAYRLFATKTYLVLPKTIDPEDQSRVEALCMLFGIGLILFELNPDAPEFDIRMRAQRFSPDMFYVNQFADRLKEYDPAMFDDLFG